MNTPLSMLVVGGGALVGVWTYFSLRIHSLQRKRKVYERRQFNGE
jgi:hypothetical protein